MRSRMCPTYGVIGMLFRCREPSELPAAAAGLDFVESSLEDLLDELSTSLRNCWLFMAVDGEPAERAAEDRSRNSRAALS